MKRTEVNIRDPFVLVSEGKYYLYGTRSATTWGKADGFDVYVSRDLENWEGPKEIFHRPEGFFADQNYWAPECIYYKGAYYLIATLGAEDRKKGTYILRSSTPDGTFEVYSERITPEDWTCIDATVYIENGTPYLIFSHTLEESPDGDFCIMELSEDLKIAVSAPEVLFRAKDTVWAHAIPFGKEEFGIDGPAYFSDGPFVIRTDDGQLWMTISSWGEKEYAVGAARSASGSIKGPWIQQETPIWPENGGHGMSFRDLYGKMIFTLHYPNTKTMEHPTFWEVIIEDGTMRLGKELH